MLRELLLATLLFLTVGAVTVTVATVLVLRQLHHRNRVSPAVRSQAPLRWLWSGRRAARLHRRLRGAVVASRLAAPLPLGASRQLADDLAAEAVRIDSHLVVVGRLRFVDRARHLPPLAADVVRVEQLAARLAQLQRDGSAPLPTPDGARPLDELTAQCARVEAAQRELRQVEATAGLA